MKMPEILERAGLGSRRRVPFVPSLSPSDLKRLRQVFDSHGYDREPSASDGRGPDVLKRLFAQGLSVAFDEARGAFRPLDLERLIESGLLYEEDGGVKARFQAQPYSGLIFFSDFFQWEPARDFVLPIGPAGHYLALLTIRRQADWALDLGCGCGIQSLLAARHSRKVIATDINPRALALTRFNAELNAVDNIETRQGSFFEPVKGQRFDLIAANLPYVIAPEKHLIYRTVDEAGDASVHERLMEIPAQLTEGGLAQMLINWVHGKDQDPSEPILQALETQPMDAWLIHNGSKQPGEYSEMWLSHHIQDDPRKLERTRQNWLRWYRRRHIDRIALGAITLRRRSKGRNWFCSATVNRTLEDPAGEQFLRLFAAQDYLGRLENPELLLKESFAPIQLDFAGDENQELVRSTHGSRFESRITPRTKAVLQKLDGKTTLEEALRGAAREAGLQAAQIQPEVLAIIVELLKLGMMLPKAREQPSPPSFA